MADTVPAAAGKSERFRCPQCSADMEFDPVTGRLKCLFCGSAQALPKSNVPAAHPFDEALEHPSIPITENAIEVSCGGCGSVVAFEPPTVAGWCSFCGAAIAAAPKAADPMIAPDAVLPFKVAKSAAQTEVRQWMASRWFAPSALKKMAQDEGISGVYLPFWTYDAATESRYTGARGEHYWETENYTEADENGNTVQRSRQVQRTQWHSASGQVSRSFDNLLIAATKSVKEERLNALEPWDLGALYQYESAYLAGFKAQRYQVGLPQGFEKAKQIMAVTIQEDVRANIGGDEQHVDQVHTEYSDVMFRHLLLPVWIGAYRFQSKVYQVTVNARTGEVQGERPYSAGKITLLVTVIVAAILIIILLARE